MRTSIILITSGIIAGLGIFCIAILQPWLSYEYFFSDLSAIVDVNPLFGVTSTVVAMLWFGSGMASFLGALLVTGVYQTFLFSSAGLSAVLALDEILRFHDYVSPQLLGLGEREPKIFFIAITLLYLWIFREIIAHVRWIILAVSGCFFVSSLLIDNSFVREEIIFSWLPFLRTEAFGEIVEFLIEDTLKTIGIFLWILFHLEAARFLIREQLQMKKSLPFVLEYPANYSSKMTQHTSDSIQSRKKKSVSA
ncbi:MAG: hypothetical protein V4629_02650 [Pseudomonadota bacterium]